MSNKDEMKPEYDFSKGIRGKHYQAFRAGTNLVLLDADVARFFTDSESVNRALRMLIELASGEIHKTGKE